MDAQQERRDTADRRQLSVYYRYGSERRDYTANRRIAVPQDPAGSEVMLLQRKTPSEADDSGAAIAKAFGLAPESLEIIEYDELIGAEVDCPSCAVRDSEFAALRDELALCRKEVERYRHQLEELLLIINLRRQ